VLKTRYDDVNDIPEKYRDLYTEKDGKWILTGIEGANDADAVKRMGDQRDAARKELAAAKEKLAKFSKLGEGADLDDLLAAKEKLEETLGELEELRAQSGGKGEEAVKARVDAATARVEQKLNREIKKLQDQIAEKETTVATEKKRGDELDQRIRRRTIEAALLKAAGGAKVIDTARGDVLMYAGAFEVDDLDADEPVVRVKDNAGFTPGLAVDEWISDMKSKKPHWWATSQGGGAKGSPSGAPGGGANPFAKGSFNFTQASAAFKADPRKADMLAQQAGFADARSAMAAAGRDAARKPGAAA
jgi:hypothetical protein